MSVPAVPCRYAALMRPSLALRACTEVRIECTLFRPPGVHKGIPAILPLLWPPSSTAQQSRLASWELGALDFER